MEEQKRYLYARDSEKLQLPYNEYLQLVEKAKETERVQEVAASVAAALKSILEGRTSAVMNEETVDHRAAGDAASVEEVPQPEKVSIEFAADEQDQAAEPEKSPEPETACEPELEAESAANARGEVSEVPPVKSEIAEHFNHIDESGRLFNIFKQYYTCLNEMCGGTVRVTMKDGFCSLWNYDEWEEFAFVDIFEQQLRIAIDPRYTDELTSQNLCEVPRLLSSRRNLICVKVEDLNKTVLDVLARAFAEVGMQVG